MRQAQIKEAKLFLRQIGISASAGYFWIEDVKPQTHNLMLTSEQWTTVDPRDPDVPLEDQLHMYKGCDAEKGFVRRGDGDIRRLLQALTRILMGGVGRQYLLLQNTHTEDPARFKPEPWLEKRIKRPGQPRAAAQRLFAELDLDAGTICALEGHLPDDQHHILQLADVYWQWWSRNLYVFTDTGVKIVVCHEKDLHVCTRDAALAKSVRAIAAELNLAVAPFMIQQCN